MVVRCSTIFYAVFILIKLKSFLVGCTSRPVIIIQPQNVIVTNKHFTVLCITAKGNTVRWFRDNREIDFRDTKNFYLTKDGSLYVVSAYKQRDEGTYQCLVSNKRGAILSKKATVKFPYLHNFTTRDWVVAKMEGDHLVLRCDPPASFPNVAVHWSKVDPGAPGGTVSLPKSSHYTLSTNRELHFAYLQMSDSGDYSCTVSNKLLNKHLTRTISLNVAKAPSLSSMPPQIASEFSRRRKAIKGEEFVLECIAYGFPVPRITLRKRGLHAQLGKLDGNSRKLVIKKFSRLDAGKYKCKAAAPSGRPVSRSTYVWMEAKPEWIVKPMDLSAGLRSSVTIPCKAYGIPSISYDWYFNGDLVGSSSKHSFTGGNLTITNLSSAENGIYQCVVRNEHGEIYSSMELKVQEIPAGFGKGSKPLRIVTNTLVGATVLLHCNPTGIPKPTIMWKRGSLVILSGGRFLILPNGNLEIKNVTILDSSLYTCVVTNRLGKASRSGRLKVHNETAITQPPSSVIVNIGQDVRLTCGVDTTSSAVEVKFEWLKYFMQLPRNPRYSQGKKNKMGFLSISKVGYQDSGVYSCQVTASGTNSKDTAHALVTVQGPPDPPTNIRLGDITRNRVNITWISGRNNNSPTKKVFIQYATAFSPRYWKYFQTVDNGAWVTKKELILSPWVEYKFRLVAMNDVGNSTPSASSSIIKTPPAAPSIYPINITSKGTSPSSLLITWKPLSPIDQNGPGIHYYLYHRRADSEQSMQLNQVPRNKNSFLITGTDYYAKYEFQIQAVNNMGAGPKSPANYGFSGETLPKGKPADLKVKITSSRSAFATWTGIPNQRKLTGGKLLGYRVYFWSEPSKTKPEGTLFTTTANTSVTMRLRPFTKYRFQVVAFNSQGDGPASQLFGPVTTPETIPDPPASVDFYLQNKTFGLVEWSAPTNPNGEIIGYELAYRKLPQGEEVKTKLKNVRYSVLKTFDAEASYQVTLLALNGVGLGPPLIEVFNLKSAPLQAPKNVRGLYESSRNEATISWDRLPKEIEQGIDGYRILYWSSTSLIQVVDVDKTEEKKTIANIKTGKFHFFQVAARKKVKHFNFLMGPRSDVIRLGQGLLGSHLLKGPCDSLVEETVDENESVPSVNTRSKTSGTTKLKVDLLLWISTFFVPFVLLLPAQQPL